MALISGVGVVPALQGALFIKVAIFHQAAAKQQVAVGFVVVDGAGFGPLWPVPATALFLTVRR